MKLEAWRRWPFLSLWVFVAMNVTCSFASAQQEPVTTTTPPGGGFRVVGVLWYLRSHAAMDDLTLVYGGVKGSSALVYRDAVNGKSHWFFLEGEALYVSSANGSPWYTSTTERGQFVTTIKPYDWTSPKEGNRRELSWLLADLFELSKAIPENPQVEGNERFIRHAPFLMGKGWTQAKGATWAEVQEICKPLGLTPQAQGDTAGFVNQQNPKEGEPMKIGTGDVIKVWFDGSSTSVTPLPGDSFLAPIQVMDPSGNRVAQVQIEITPSHGNDGNSEIDVRFRKDVFLRLPPEALNANVTVKQVDPKEPMMLTAFKVVGNQLQNIPDGVTNFTAKAGLQPTLKYEHDSHDIVIMVEFFDRNTGSGTLRIEW